LGLYSLVFTGPELKKLRAEAGLTQQQLARLVGVSQAHIAKIEKEKVDPRLSTVNKILQVLSEGGGRKCKDVMTRQVVFASPDDKVLKVSEIMMERAISQLPVRQKGRIIGTITEQSIIRNLHVNIADKTVVGIMDPPLPSIPEKTEIRVIRPLLEVHPGILVTRRHEIVGIITRSDLFKIM